MNRAVRNRWLVGGGGIVLIIIGCYSYVSRNSDGDAVALVTMTEPPAKKLPFRTAHQPITETIPKTASGSSLSKATLPRDLSVEEMSAWRGKLFNDDGTLNEEMFSKFGFTVEERAFFDLKWQDALKTWQRIESSHIRTTSAKGSVTEIEVDPFPAEGASFRKNFIARIDGKVPPSFVRFFSELSHDDAAGTFADYGRARQRYVVEATTDGWTLTREVSRFSEDYNAWVMNRSASLSFKEIPQRFSLLFERPQ